MIHQMTPSEERALAEWTDAKEKRFNAQKRIYNVFAVALSAVDVTLGILTIIFDVIAAAAAAVSAITLIVYGARLVQIIKLEQLVRAVARGAYSRIQKSKQRSLHMQKIWENIKNNPLTIVLGIIGGVIAGFLGDYFFAKIIDNGWHVVCGVACGIVVLVLVLWLGWDGVKAAIARRIAKKEGITEEILEELDEEADTEIAKAEAAAEQAAAIAKAQAEAAAAAAQKEAEEAAERAEAEATIAEYNALKQAEADREAKFRAAQVYLNSHKK